MVSASEVERILPAIQNDFFFSVYPNPTTGKFTLEINHNQDSSSGVAIIYSILGKLIQKCDVEGMTKNEISLDNCPPGIYIVNLIFSNRIRTIKIIKQN